MMISAKKCGALAAVLALAQLAGADERKKVVSDKIPSDQEFLAKALAGGVKEVQLGEKARDKASSDDVKKFAQRMIDDHTRAARELMDVASRKGFRPVPAMTEKHLDVFVRLGKELKDFDAQYAASQVESHEEAVALFEKQAKEGKDADLKAFAEKTLPTLKEHLKLAQDLNRDVGKGPKDKEPPKDKDQEKPQDR